MSSAFSLSFLKIEFPVQAMGLPLPYVLPSLSITLLAYLGSLAVFLGPVH
jgi:hypothetical protein